MAVAISALLPWFGSSFGSLNGFDVPAAFLWSIEADQSFPNIGIVILVVGAAVLATEFMDRFASYRMVATGVAIGVAALWLIQTFRAFLDYEGEFTTALSTTLTDGFAIGPWVALAAGIVLLLKQPSDTTAS